MDLNDLFRAQDITAKCVLVLRHRPWERELNRVLPWLAAERPELFNAYQQIQSPKLEKAMQSVNGTGYVASFVGHEPGKALFVGLYAIKASRLVKRSVLMQQSVYRELEQLGMRPNPNSVARTAGLVFDLKLLDFYSHWKGNLVIGWPPPEISWWRWASRNTFPVLSVLDYNALAQESRPDWQQIDLSWHQLGLLPTSWRSALSEWRGIYFIFDRSDGKGYVGSAYGKQNLLGRWTNYAKRGHGGNSKLRTRDPANFQFSILERVSPDMGESDVIRLESTWKERLHTRKPFGLNDN